MAAELQDLEPLRLLLEHPPLGLVTDIDGTLAPIVPHPDDAFVTPRARTAIKRLIEQGVRVSFVTGRPLATARRMTGIEDAYYAANHGLDLWTDGATETPAEVLPYVSWAREVMGEIGEIQFPGVFVEDKGANVAFHYRLAEDETGALAAILEAIGRSKAAQHFAVQQARKVVELRPALSINKGTAARELVQRMRVKGVLAIGDDMTDVKMFEGVRSLKLPSVIVGVWNEEFPEVVENSDYFVRGITGVEELLEDLSQELGANVARG